MESNIGNEPGEEIVNVFHVAITSKMNESDDTIADKWSEVLMSKADILHKLKIRSANVLVAATPKNPRYFSFPHCDGFKEDKLRRNMRPTFHHLLELARLTSNHELVRMKAVGKNAQVYLGTEQSSGPRRGPPPQVLFVRALSHSVDVATSEGARRALLQGLDELERAQSDARVSVGIGAYIVRLGQRIIQMKQGPMILTGFSALNKLLGKEVYTSQDQLGGPQVMYPNGVTHEVVENDKE